MSKSKKTIKIEKVIEIVFIEKFNTTAIVLNSRILVRLWDGKYMDREECIKYIHKNFKGWVQTSEQFRIAKKYGEKTGIKSDPILPYENLYNELSLYAQQRR